jgi:hypothetical protein
MVISLGAGFSFGQLICGGLREYVGPLGVLLVGLAVMPFLAYGFYLNLSAIAANMEAANIEAANKEAANEEE